MILAAFLALQAPAADPGCTLANAVPASVREMASTPERWLGRCVRIEGYAFGTYFMTDVAGVYAALSSLSTDRENDGWLGLDFLSPGHIPQRLMRGTVYGTVHDCELDYDAASESDSFDDWVMPVYCRYRGGLLLRGAGFRVGGPASFERQTSEAARRQFGDLTAASPGLEPPAEMVALAERFLSALRAGDGGALLAFVGPWSEPRPETAAAREAFAAYLLGEGGSPLRELRSMAQAPQHIFFRQGRARAHAHRPFTWHVCYCRTADCSGRWPIIAEDAVTGLTRPYVCLRGFEEGHADAAPNRLAIERRDSVYPEPARYE